MHLILQPQIQIMLLKNPLLIPEIQVGSSDFIALSGVVVSACGFLAAVVGVWRGNRNSSAALLLSFQQAVTNRWEMFSRSANQEDAEKNLIEVLNVLEIACYLEKAGDFSGVSRKLLTDYLDQTISKLSGDPDAWRLILKFHEKNDDFSAIVERAKIIPS